MGESKEPSGWKHPAVLTAIVTSVAGLVTAIATGFFSRPVVTPERGPDNVTPPAARTPSSVAPEPPGAAWPSSLDLDIRESFVNTETAHERGYLIGPDDDGTWTGSIVDGRMAFENHHGAGSITTQWFDTGPRSEQCPVTIEVDLSGAAPSGGGVSSAGLMYRYDDRRGTYYAFVLTSDDTAELWERTPGGRHDREILKTWVVSKAEAGKPHVLGMIGIESTLHLYLNGRRLGSVQNNALDSGYVGYLAMGTGRFLLDDLTIYHPVKELPP